MKLQPNDYRFCLSYGCSKIKINEGPWGEVETNAILEMERSDYTLKPGPYCDDAGHERPF